MMSGRARGIRVAVLSCLFAGPWCVAEEPEGVRAPGDEPERAALLARSEELLLELSTRLPELAEAVQSRSLPGPGTARELFRERIAVEGPGEAAGAEVLAEGPGKVERTVWPCPRKEEAVGVGALALWEPALARFASVGNARFSLVDGRFDEGSADTFHTEVAFEGSGSLRDGGIGALAAKQRVTWEREPAGWRIAAWRQVNLSVDRAPAAFFREVLDEALPDAATLRRARVSLHERNIVELFTNDRFQVRTTNTLYAKHTDLEGLFQHPAVSVVDIDGDGFDDLYVMARWGRNLLLRNRGDGTFEDIAGRIGLDIADFCNAALFADFDNDGDPDLMLGRSLERSMYLVNEGGRFVDRTGDRVDVPLPMLVATISAADYNGDGLLDVYLGLYGPATREQSVASWAADFFPPAMVAAMVEREKASHRYLSRLGPPNLLLVNRGGGRFGVAPEAEQLAEWLNTFQSAWIDFDGDGDQDAYVCNDFGPDHLYRNEGRDAAGRVRFKEISEEIAGRTMLGFGMGASWGDYDGDGRFDLYVSNMYSKAGKRITAAFDGLDPRLAYSAGGSLLFHNEGTRFRQVAGTEGDAVRVAKVGWAWGGQFCDFDNDGAVDIYAASGFYTAPPELRPQKDL